MKITVQWLQSHKVIGVFLLLVFFLSAPIIRAAGPSSDEKAAIAATPTKAEEWQVLAKSPGVKIISEVQKSPGLVLQNQENPEDKAQDWLMEQGFEEGRNLINGKLLYVSMGSASVNAPPNDPAFIDSRYLAFERAELEAKAKTAIYLGVDLATSRGTSEREIDPQERFQLEKLVNTSPTLKKKLSAMGVFNNVAALFRKAGTLAHAKLDEALEKSNSKVAADWRQKQISKKQAAEADKKRQRSLRTISDASLKTAASAFSDVQGSQIIKTYEGSYEEGYKVVVITLWSQNLQRLADIMINGSGYGQMTRKKAKEEVIKQLPTDPNELACLVGVRSFINQHGEYILTSFGQSGVEITARRDKAFERAGKKARLRAMAAMRRFMGEKVAFSASEDLMEVLAEYASKAGNNNPSAEYHNISDFEEKVQAISKKQRITGLHGLMTKELVHPFTDYPIVLKVMAWSPASQALSREMKKQINTGRNKIPDLSATTTGTAAEKKVEDTVGNSQRPAVPTRKGLISSGKGADPDAY